MSFQHSVESVYTTDGGQAYQNKKHSVSDHAYDLIAVRRSIKLQPYIKPQDRVFEFGIGNGWNLAKLVCKTKSGYDISTVLAEKVIAQGVSFVNDLAAVPLHSFDTVVCHHVLEHVTQPAETLAVLKQLLDSQGKVVLFVPYENQWRYRHYQRNEANQHLYSWNVQTFAALVEKSGFEVVEAKLNPFGYERFVANLVSRFRLPDVAFVLLLKLARLLKPAYEIKVVATLHG